MNKATLVQTYPILKYFEYSHLTEQRQEASKMFCDLAFAAATKASVGHHPEVEEGLRKLLEAKDCFVRASVK